MYWNIWGLVFASSSTEIDSATYDLVKRQKISVPITEWVMHPLWWGLCWGFFLFQSILGFDFWSLTGCINILKLADAKSVKVHSKNHFSTCLVDLYREVCCCLTTCSILSLNHCNMQFFFTCTFWPELYYNICLLQHSKMLSVILLSATE